ncbi:hypothetical protein PPN31114_03514 [Pandoraea pneumonica]|uniref:DUF3168 domain-containing protein n=1 Tax=Pandoraea pneumonica TaxID=2508299 RepID=A0A5E4WUL8_9BURK|nr:DUF3168 domain-containing protein [Pandoraea pneumonica]VVE28221.1 hypothetical protein PPN31114_03514 [Pandoraea pneumonica]
MIEKAVQAALEPVTPGAVFPGTAPQGAQLPRITYQGIGGKPNVTLRGPSSTQNARMQIDAYAKSLLEALAVMDGAFLALTRDAVLKAIPLEGNPRWTKEADTGLWRASRDFSIWFTN